MCVCVCFRVLQISNDCLLLPQPVIRNELWLCTFFFSQFEQGNPRIGPTSIYSNCFICVKLECSTLQPRRKKQNSRFPITSLLKFFYSFWNSYKQCFYGLHDEMHSCNAHLQTHIHIFGCKNPKRPMCVRLVQHLKRIDIISTIN